MTRKRSSVLAVLLAFAVIIGFATPAAAAEEVAQSDELVEVAEESAAADEGDVVDETAAPDPEAADTTEAPPTDVQEDVPETDDAADASDATDQVAEEEPAAEPENDEPDDAEEATDDESDEGDAAEPEAEQEADDAGNEHESNEEEAADNAAPAEDTGPDPNASEDEPVEPEAPASVAPTSGVTPPAHQPKQEICHRNSNPRQPYGPKRIEVAFASVDGQPPANGDHFLSHTGPVFAEGVSNWGDIIPPIDGVHGGLNWDAAGQAIWNNNCQIPQPDPDFGELTANIDYECGNTFALEMDQIGGDVDGTALVIVDGVEHFYTVTEPSSVEFPINADTTVVVKQIGLKGEVLAKVLDTTVHFEECPVVEPPAPVKCPSGSERWVNPSLGDRRASLILTGQSIATGITVPAGTVTITGATSWDGYVGRSSTNQVQEIWSVNIGDGPKGGSQFGSTTDIPDGVEWGQTVTDLGTYVTTGGEMTVYHTGDASSANSVVPVSFCYTVVPPEPEPESDPDAEIIYECGPEFDIVLRELGGETEANLEVTLFGVPITYNLAPGQSETLRVSIPDSGSLDVLVRDPDTGEVLLDTTVEYVPCPEADLSAAIGEIPCEATTVPVTVDNSDGTADGTAVVTIDGVATEVTVPAGETLSDDYPLPNGWESVVVTVTTGEETLTEETLTWVPCPAADLSAAIGEIPCEATTVPVTVDNSDGTAEGEAIVTIFGQMTPITVPAGESRTVDVDLPDNWEREFVQVATIDGEVLAETTVVWEECPFANPDARATGPLVCFDASVVEAPDGTLFLDNSDANVPTVFVYEVGHPVPPIGTALAVEIVPAGQVVEVPIGLTFGETTPVVVSVGGEVIFKTELTAERCPVTTPSGSGEQVCRNVNGAAVYDRTVTVVDPDGVVTSVSHASAQDVPNVDTLVTIEWVDAYGVAQEPITFTIAKTVNCVGELPVTGSNGTQNLLTAALGLMLAGAFLVRGATWSRRRELALATVPKGPFN